MQFEQACPFLMARTRFAKEDRTMVYRPSYFAMAKVLDDPGVPTAAATGDTLYFNVPWMRQWTVDEQMGVIAHEICHKNLRHHLRWPPVLTKAKAIYGALNEDATFKIWNIAMDTRINPDLLADGFKLPSDRIDDPTGKYKGWSAERIFFDMLKAEKARQDAGGKPEDGPKMPGWGSFSPFTGTGEGGKATEEEIREEEHKISRQVSAGMAMAKARGVSPGAMKELIKETIKPVDWKDRLPEEIQKAIGADEYTSSRMSRAGRRMGVILPGTMSYKLGKVGMAFDTSGSIGIKELMFYGAQANGLIQFEQPEEIVLLQCDAKVQHVQRLDQGDTIGKIAVHGRGGTKFEPVFDWFEENEPDIEMLVYMTDGYGSFPKEAPPYHTIWLCTSDVVAPFGTTIRIHP